MRYVFITGGVCSSLGKGLAAASIGLLLEKHGLNVSMMKIDPYLNVDPGTMSPYQHGEVYVTDDGAETDLDLGHYYRYTNSPLSKDSSASAGSVYQTVIRRERKGDYLGQTVQVIPHITDEVKRRICRKEGDVTLVEIGGTVGDIEGLPIFEAIRQMHQEEECLNIHLTYVPYLKAAGEVKTKPTQHSVQALRQIGLIPDIILCRSEKHLGKEIRDKISLFCGVRSEAVIEAVDVEHSVYELPKELHEQGIDQLICKHFGLKTKKINLSEWEAIVEKVTHPKGKVTIGLIGKYVKHQDAYKSVVEALHHAAIHHNLELKLKFIEAGSSIDKCDGYIVPGGFGERGWPGKLKAAQHCREKKIPYFGICLGMQALVTEFARNVAGLHQANTTEIDPGTPEPVISLLAEQENVQHLGGTMRLGAYPCHLSGKAAEIYGAKKISERHRHRYEFNNKFKEPLEKAGLKISGIWKEGNLAEIVEVPDHPWMIGVQFHPEFQSKPTKPHPLFSSFIQASHG